ncbi:MAG: hypothetical protein ACOVOV_14815, partial [Dolichospermum sp.]
SALSGSVTYKWYTVASGGTPIKTETNNTGSTSDTLQDYVIGNNTLYVSQTGSTGCESDRTQIDVNVTNPPTLVVSQSDSVQTCQNKIETLTVTTGALDFTSFVWTPITNLYTDAAATVAYNGTGNPTTVYYKRSSAVAAEAITLTATAGACTNSSVVVFKVGANPVVSAATASPAALCPNATVTLNAASIVATAGSANIGTSTTTEFNGSPYRAGGATGDFKVQYLVSAAEMTAAGFTPGNLTALTFNVTSGASANGYSNYTISLGHTSSTVLTNTFNTASLTQVYTAATYSSVVGDNVHTFNTPFNWDGTSNILINICYNVPVFGTSSTVSATTPANVSNTYLVGGASNCTATSGTATANRPLIKFNGQVGTNFASGYTWNWTATGQ